jgi:hypothetical protein
MSLTATCSQYQRRYAILDGRDTDLDADLPVSLVPVISKVRPSHNTAEG